MRHSASRENGVERRHVNATTVGCGECFGSLAKNLLGGRFIFGGGAEMICNYIGLGFTFFAAAVDVDLLQAGAAALLKAMREV